MTTAIEKIDYASPNKFLKEIGKYLDQNGGLTDGYVENLVEFMKESKNYLVPKCITISIISLTQSDVQTKLCESRAWNILFQWLQEGLKNDTTCFIVDLLKLYLTLPINFSHLKSNACPKLIKKLTKTGNEEIIPIANDIYNKWKQLVHENTKKDVVPAEKVEEKPDVINSVKVKPKLSTVKVKSTNFRTAGLEEDNEKNKKIDPKPEKAVLPSNEEMHQKIDKRKVIELHESSNFMNALMQHSAPPKKKKKARCDNNGANKSIDDLSKADTSANEEIMETSMPEIMLEKQKKRVSWAPSESIETVHFFELDENERVNVNRISIEEMRKKEKLMEKQTVSKKFIMDEDDEFVDRWFKPSLITTPMDITIDSLEKSVQQDRERKVLKVFYFQKEAIPDSATEPDTESFEFKQPKIIPLTEVVSSPKSKSPPQPTLPSTPVTPENEKLIIITENDGTEPKASLRPDIASMLKSLTQTSTNSVVPATNCINVEEESRSSSNDPALKSKLVSFIRNRHPEIEPETLSCEELYHLLVPMRDQLIREGINLPDNFQNNTSLFYQPPPPPPPHYVGIPHPHNNQWYPSTDHMQPVRPPRFYAPHHMAPVMHRPPPPHRNQYRNPHRSHGGHSSRNQICRFYASKGYCRQGQNCTYSHSIPPDYKRH